MVMNSGRATETEAGTVLVKDINPGAGSSSITNLTNINGKLYFRANDGSGVKHWVSDGPLPERLPCPAELRSAGSASSRAERCLLIQTNQVWTTNGTAAGTTLLTAAGANTFSGSLFTDTFLTIGDTLYARASNATGGAELFKFNRTLSLSNQAIPENQTIGATVGTFATNPSTGTITYTLVSGLGDTGNSNFTIVGNQLKTATSFDFEAQSSYSIRVRTTDQSGSSFERSFTISVTDRREADFEVVKDIRSGTTGSAVRNLTNFNGTLYFAANDGSAGYEFWKSNATPGGNYSC